MIFSNIIKYSQNIQNANDWDYPIDETLSSSQSNKSQNPSPISNKLTFDQDEKKNICNTYKTKEPPISPLSADATLSSEETSASSSPIHISHDNGCRGSMEEDMVCHDIYIICTHSVQG